MISGPAAAARTPDGRRPEGARPLVVRAPRSKAPVLELRPRPPFRLDLTVWALRRRKQNQIDHWEGRIYRRALLLADGPLELEVTQRGPAARARLEVRISGRWTSGREDAVRSTLTRLLGLEVDLSGFYARAGHDHLLGPLADRYRGLKPPRFPSLFECLLNAVACQQLSLAAGLTLLNRLASAGGRRADTLHTFPEPTDVLRLSPSELRSIGFSARKAATMLALADTAASGAFDLAQLEPLDDEAVRERLIRQPGIGPWSADYVLLRGLGRLHVFPRADIGAFNGLRRLLTNAGSTDEPRAVLARLGVDAGLLYFHLLLCGLEENGVLTSVIRDV